MSVARLAWFGVPVLVGVLLALNLAMAVHGYAAAYSYGAAALIAALSALVGAVFLLFSWTRTIGRRLLVATLLFLIAFGGLWGAAELLDLVRWRQVGTAIPVR